MSMIFCIQTSNLDICIPVWWKNCLNILQDTSLKWQYDAVFVERKVWKCRTEFKGIQTPSFIASFETIQLQICVCTEIRGVTYSYKREYAPASNSMEITFNTNHELFFWYSQEKFSGMNQTRELNVTYSWKSQLSMFYTVWESANSFHNMQF